MLLDYFNKLIISIVLIYKHTKGCKTRRKKEDVAGLARGGPGRNCTLKRISTRYHLQTIPINGNSLEGFYEFF